MRGWVGGCLLVRFAVGVGVGGGWGGGGGGRGGGRGKLEIVLTFQAWFLM